MGTKVESYRADDGQLFGSEEAMMVHEATVALCTEFPQLKVQIPFIMANHERIAEILYPLHVKRLEIEGSPTEAPKGPIPVVPERPLVLGRPIPEEREDRGGCGCSASLDGGPHHISCPMYIHVGSPLPRSPFDVPPHRD